MNLVTDVQVHLPPRPTEPVVSPVLDGPEARRVWMAVAFLLGAMLRETPGDPDAAARALRPHAADAALTRLVAPFSPRR